jgi:hypothetical protein
VVEIGHQIRSFQRSNLRRFLQIQFGKPSAIFGAGGLDDEKEFVGFDVPGGEQLFICGSAFLGGSPGRPGVWILCSPAASSTGLLCAAKASARVGLGCRIL